MTTHTAFFAAAESYNFNGGVVAYAVRQDARQSYLAGRDAIDAGQRSAEVAMAKARIAERGN